jgi:hypothetical protein
MDVVERVAYDLAMDGEVGPRDGRGLVVHAYRGRRFAPPVILHLDGLAGYLDSMSEDAVQVFPDVAAQEGAYRLLLVHLEELLLANGGDAPISIAIGEEGLVVSRVVSAAQVPDPDGAAGEGRSWTTGPLNRSLE